MIYLDQIVSCQTTDMKLLIHSDDLKEALEFFRKIGLKKYHIIFTD